jgi:hypothetical protein
MRRLDSVVLGLTAEECQLGAFFLDAGSVLVRRNGGAVPAVVVDLIDAMRRAALENGPRSEPGSDAVPQLVDSGSEVAESVLLLTQAVADRLNITDRGVRKLAESGRIKGQKCGAGGAAAWVFDERSVSDYELTRRPRKDTTNDRNNDRPLAARAG